MSLRGQFRVDPPARHRPVEAPRYPFDGAIGRLERAPDQDHLLARGGDGLGDPRAINPVPTIATGPGGEE